MSDFVEGRYGNLRGKGRGELKREGRVGLLRSRRFEGLCGGGEVG